MKKAPHKGYRLLTAGLFFLLLSLSLDSFLLPALQDFYLSRKVHMAQKNLHKEEEAAVELLKKAVNYPENEHASSQKELYKLSRKEGIYLYIYQSNSLVFWTSNDIFPSRLSRDTKGFLQKLDNGYYEQYNTRHNGYVYVALIPIQYNYSFENQYLQNHLALYPTDDINFRILEDEHEEGTSFINKDGRFLFKLQATLNPRSFGWIALFYLAGILLIALAIHRMLIAFLARKQLGRAFFAYGIFLLGFVLMWKFFKVPDVLYTLPVFSAKYYASSDVFSSLGDLIIFTLLLVYTIRLLMRLPWRIRFRRQLRIPLVAAVLLISFLFAAAIEHLISSLILDSQISFNLSNVFGLNEYSFAGLAIIFCWLGCYFLWLRRSAPWVSRQFAGPEPFAYLLTAFLLVSALALFFLKLDYWPSLAFTGLCFSGYFLFFHQRNRSWISLRLSFLAIASLLIAVSLSRYSLKNDEEVKHVIASRLATERDAVAEFLFGNIYNELLNDYYLKGYFFNPVQTQEILAKRVRQLYFSGYFSKYDVEVSSFSAEGLPYKSNYDKPLSFYLNILAKNATPVREDYLFFLHNYNGLPSYIAIIPLYKDDNLLGTVMLDFRQKAFYEESVYPELLLSENVQRFKELNTFSYAVYSGNRLLTQRGEYAYPGVIAFQLHKDTGTYQTFTENEYSHLVHQVNPNLIVIVSSPTHTLLYYLSIFSFLLLFFALSWLLVFLAPYGAWLVKRFLRMDLSFLSWKNSLWNRLSFRYKILATIIAGMSLALLVIGFATVKYIQLQYSKDESDKLRRKTRFVTTRLENELQHADQYNPIGQDELSSIIKNLSDVYQLDINLFDLDGNLIASTQSLIYDREVLEPKMNPKAYIKFNTEYASQIIQEERIGLLRFTASYLPIRNVMGDIIGYINLPYFSKEQELSDRISSFLVALINLYLFLFLVLVAVGIGMAKALTSPLDIIRKYLRNTDLSGSTEMIVWHNNDEIGKLVNEYNTMIVALRESAARLAQSEREGAWREMAKQVAHEIKNPLTPMKLNIQRLQLAYYQGTADLDILFEKVTNLLINQIESLSQIATAFSEFAKMPHGEPQPLDVNSVIQEVAELFGHHKGIKLSVDTVEEELVAFMDRNQLGRVINNLLKNAIQAIPENRPGEVKISSGLSEGMISIMVSDNGSGMPDELAQKVFIPNFSTKSSGMGLGLAIVKNILEKAGGSISFVTREGIGSTFTVKLPLYRGLPEA